MSRDHTDLEQRREKRKQTVINTALWFALFLGIEAVLCALLTHKMGSFSNAAFVVGLVAFFIGVFSMMHGTSQDFNPRSYLGSRCVESMQDPGNDKYARRHMKESVFIANKKGLALALASMIIFGFSFF